MILSFIPNSMQMSFELYSTGRHHRTEFRAPIQNVSRKPRDGRQEMGRIIRIQNRIRQGETFEFLEDHQHQIDRGFQGL